MLISFFVAHFAVRWIGNDFYIIAGSKNVHLLFRTAEDIEKYEESRFLVARDVARTCFQFFSAMEARRRSALFSFFHHTKYTAVLEILLPHYQHVEDLSYLAAPELYFISWSRTDFGTGFREEICVAPDFGQKIAQDFGLKVTGYEVVLYADLTKKLTDIRKAHGYEGEVLYFIDKEGKVIGLLKKKTIWWNFRFSCNQTISLMSNQSINQSINMIFWLVYDYLSQLFFSF